MKSRVTKTQKDVCKDLFYAIAVRNIVLVDYRDAFTGKPVALLCIVKKHNVTGAIGFAPVAQILEGDLRSQFNAPDGRGGYTVTKKEGTPS